MTAHDESFRDIYETLRLDMVEKQIAQRGIDSPRVLQAMREVPRHLFVPEKHRSRAYEDRPLEIGAGQTISQPFMVAAMTAFLAPAESDRVLEIGTGSGYQAAVLARLARVVHSVERVPALAESAQRTLYQAGYENVTVHVADGTCGWPPDAPYDAIIVTAGAPKVPLALTEQLADGGRLVCPVGTRRFQKLVRVDRLGDEFREAAGMPCVFVPLIGEDGWGS